MLPVRARALGSGGGRLERNLDARLGRLWREQVVVVVVPGADELDARLLAEMLVAAGAVAAGRLADCLLTIVLLR